MRKCYSRSLISFGLIIIGTIIVLRPESFRQNINNQTNMSVEISQTNPAVVSEVTEKSEVSHTPEEETFDSVMRERREVMRAACHHVGLDKKGNDDLHRTVFSTRCRAIA